MSNDKIMTMLQEKSQPEYYRFIAEDDEKCCDDCKKHNDKIFQENDPDIPKLPIHPNCRCKLERFEFIKEQNILSKKISNNFNVHEKNANDLAAQIIKIQHNNSILSDEKNFIFFDGRYFVANTGDILFDAISGKAIYERVSISNGTDGSIISTKTFSFDYSYERQGMKNTGGIPSGLYYIKKSEERSLYTSPYSHGLKRSAWGSYSWTLHPATGTNTRNRGGFFIHGGNEYGSAGCIDLKNKDVEFKKYLESISQEKIYIFVDYPQQNINISDSEIIFHSEQSRLR